MAIMTKLAIEILARGYEQGLDKLSGLYSDTGLMYQYDEEARSTY